MINSNGRLQSQRANNHQIQPIPQTTYRQHQQQPNNMILKKIDILFYHTIISMKKHHNLFIIYHLIKAIIFIIFIPIDYSVIKQPEDNKILAAMIIAIIVSTIQSLTLSIYRFYILRDNILLINICQQMNHSTQENITDINQTKQIKNCVSQTMYNRQNQTLINNQGLTPQMKKMYQNFLQSNIKQILTKYTPCLNCFSNLTVFLGFASMVYAIVALATGDENQAELVLLIIYIVLEGLSKFLIVLVILFIALFPVICCLGIFVICCCAQWKRQAKLPEPQKATQQMIVEADGTCSICYQNFIVDENVIRLKCSAKHMFHPLCISGWTKVKATCPICRAVIDGGEQIGNV